MAKDLLTGLTPEQLRVLRREVPADLRRLRAELDRAKRAKVDKLDPESFALLEERYNTYKEVADAMVKEYGAPGGQAIEDAAAASVKPGPTRKSVT